MHYGVPDQIALFGEAAATLAARVWPLASVAAHVLLQLAKTHESPLTERTSEAALSTHARYPLSPETSESATASSQKHLVGDVRAGLGGHAVSGSDSDSSLTGSGQTPVLLVCA